MLSEDFKPVYDLTELTDSIAAIQDHDLTFAEWVQAYSTLIKTGWSNKLGHKVKTCADSLIYQGVIDKDGNVLNWFDE